MTLEEFLIFAGVLIVATVSGVLFALAAVQLVEHLR